MGEEMSPAFDTFHRLMMQKQDGYTPEPCLKDRCYSPLACQGFGYCRERNFIKAPDLSSTPNGDHK